MLILVLIIILLLILLILLLILLLFATQTPDFAKQAPRFPFNVERWGRGGEDEVMILPSRTAVYFGITYIDIDSSSTSISSNSNSNNSNNDNNNDDNNDDNDNDDDDTNNLVTNRAGLGRALILQTHVRSIFKLRISKFGVWFKRILT